MFQSNILKAGHLSIKTKRRNLDGVTFWANDGQYNPPPYIHLEVVDKDMFIEKRYSYKMDLEKSTRIL